MLPDDDLRCRCAGEAQCSQEMSRDDGLCDFCRDSGGKARPE